ncbi:hypothetical protein C900_05225 [Fulvivirga imtechensis AK7]|uniref:DUF547 domain-containing protein n=1 Tax=Fulvivirga imtechensis AK7 TaxID=1237149 RepID=L8JVV2_9BACT|nr:DUF547 domain-containing protein [Fulvivirga imtechensis]ELR73176.1 hypothetical protein C900_05225 [Fulvivirga imtechensis AK7]
MKMSIIVGLCLMLVACSEVPREVSQTPPSHQQWHELLLKHVKQNGRVDYRGFITDKEGLNGYLDSLSAHAPAATWSREERLAYWINAYNAFTIKLIVDNYPVESIRDLGPALTIPGIHTVWHMQFFELGGKPTSLDEIEHGILRKEFDEPRIHFAINCASVSCPPLRRGAFTSDHINEQLHEQAVAFINDPTRNKISKDRVEVSKIFSWFEADFTKNGSLRDFLNQYSEVKISEKMDIKYLGYDWRLNE